MGSVFSPYYAAARRHSAHADPRRHVAVNAILYGPGASRWAMTERDETAFDAGEDHLSIGPSSLRWTGETLEIDIDERCMPLPRRLKGRIVVRPSAMFGEIHALDRSGRHRWRPVAPSCNVEVLFSRPGLRWNGTAYLDMNNGDEPLETAFRSWTWSRSAMPDRTRIFYDPVARDGTRRELALDYGHDGELSIAPSAQLRPLPRTLWRVWRAARGEAPHRDMRTLEDTPFYTRTAMTARLDGNGHATISESVDLDRFSTRWVQSLLPFRMPRRAGRRASGD